MDKITTEEGEILVSVCTGAILLAEAGVLDNKRATTHWMDLDRLEKEYPKVEVIRKVKFIDEGHILTSGGISAGINSTTRFRGTTYETLGHVFDLKSALKGAPKSRSTAKSRCKINMSFHSVKRLFRVEVATDLTKRMEYDIEI